jgi:hypothetical protein
LRQAHAAQAIMHKSSAITVELGPAQRKTFEFSASKPSPYFFPVQGGL